VRELASRQTPKLKDHDLSRVNSPRRVAFTKAKDSRLAPGSSVITVIKLRIRRQIGVPFEDYSFSSSAVSRPALDPQS
jgi:hypothetical protein